MYSTHISDLDFLSEVSLDLYKYLILLGLKKRLAEIFFIFQVNLHNHLIFSLILNKLS